jgi:eukaryotic-like serine/threonine-protein kinase
VSLREIDHRDENYTGGKPKSGTARMQRWRPRSNRTPLVDFRHPTAVLGRYVNVPRETLKRMGPSAENLEGVLAGTDYRLIRRLGKGGMGDVYVVEHRLMGRQFALKLLRSHLLADPQFSERLRVEAQAAARLNHPNIVEMVDLWLSREGYPCVVMELLHGKPLSQELDERRSLPAHEAIALALQALSGLAAAHALGVVHRDVKPENLFLQEIPGFARRLKILDFGIARVLPGASHLAPDPIAVPTKTGAVLGSPRFMSPEAARGERVDHRADLFSLGVVLYVMLTGRGPHDRPALRVPPPSTFASEGIDAQLDAVVLRSIAERAENRFQSAAAFTEALSSATRELSPSPATR